MWLGLVARDAGGRVLIVLGGGAKFIFATCVPPIPEYSFGLQEQQEAKRSILLGLLFVARFGAKSRV